MSKHQSQERFYSKHNHNATSQFTSHPLQCNERKPIVYTASTGSITPKTRIQWGRLSLLHPTIRRSINTRPLNRIGDHAKGYNLYSIGICYEGGLDKDGKSKDTRTPEQRAALRLLVDELLARFPGCKVCGHRDLSSDLNHNGKIDPHEWRNNVRALM